MIAEEWKNELELLANAEKAKILSGFFKTGKGQYGEGDIFLGITVPQNRSVAKKYYNAPLGEIMQLLNSPIHEFRLSALISLVTRFKKSKSEIERKEIVNFYLDNTSYINNWDLVDLSCEYILGEYLLTKPHNILFELSNSSNLWEQRIAIVTTLTFVRNNNFDTALKIAKKYLTHKHDLIQKATGWILREIGKKDIAVLRSFLDTHAHHMPRTALRYSIEKFSQEERKYYLNLKRQLR